MDENQKAVNEKEKSSKDNHSNKNKDSKKSIKSNFNDLVGEFRKLIWPSKKELVKKTATVIVTSLLVGVIIVSMDAVYGFALNTFSELIAK